MIRYALFVHDPDGDSGYGCIVGGSGMSADAAETKAAAIRRRGELQGVEVEVFVLPVVSASTSAREIAKMVVEPAVLEEAVA